MPRWHFFRAGGVDQVEIRSGDDVARIGELDQKLWVALACPTRGIEFDTRTLDLIDTDHDGRIRPPELIAACRWACTRLLHPDELLAGDDSLAIDELDQRLPPDDALPGGNDEASMPSLADEARRVLQLAGRESDTRITLADVRDRLDHLAAMRFNGDGVITESTADDAEVRRTIAQISAANGSVADCSGEAGIDRSRAEAFFASMRALVAWERESEATGCDARLHAAAEALEAVRVKVDDFFVRCRLAAYDPMAAPALDARPEHYDALAVRSLELDDAGIAALPLARVTPVGRLPWVDGVNPAWSGSMRNLKTAADALSPDAAASLPQDLDEAGWIALKAKVEPCLAWIAARPPVPPGTANGDAAVAWLQCEPAVMSLIDQDERTAPHNRRLLELEKLMCFKRDLVRLLRNFVSFEDFYRRRGAIFQAGTLYLDGRSCDLAVRVEDAKQHAVVAGLAKTCLAYCDCRRGSEKMTVAAAFTAGDVDFLFVGRNGVFYDRQGRDWDATITRLIENPTSVSQAFFSPYKKFVRLIEEQVAKRAAASEAGAQSALGTLASGIVNVDKAVPSAGKPAATAGPLPGGRIDVGTVAAIGVALGSISAVLVGIFGKFVDLGQWIPVALAGIVLAISGPSMLIAWLKLRQRSLGPLLDASGWAVNGRMKVNVRLGASLSKTAHVPADASRAFVDLHAPSRKGAYVLALVVVAAAAVWLAW